MLNIFDLLKNISETNKDLSDSHQEFDKVYNPYMITKFISMDKSTLFFANCMNTFWELPKKLQYLFYLHGIENKRRFFKYQKVTIPDTKYIQEYFECNEERASEIERLLPEKAKKEIRKIIDIQKK